MRAELAEAHAALSRVVEAMDDHLYTLRVDPDGGYRTVYRGPNREALAGGPLPGGARTSALGVARAPRRPRALALGRRAPAGGRSRSSSSTGCVGLDGRERIVLDHLRPRREADGTLFYDGVTRDVTERRRLEDELRRAQRAQAELRARTDELTGAFNRRHFAEIVEEALRQDPTAAALLLLDADHFKQVNDVHGHVVGDAVLVELARRLRAAWARTTAWPAGAARSSPCCCAASRSDAELDRRARAAADAPSRARRSPPRA